MAVVYQIDQGRQRIHTRCVGEVTLEAVQEHFTVLSRALIPSAARDLGGRFRNPAGPRNRHQGPSLRSG